MRRVAMLGFGLFLVPQGAPPAPATPGAHAIWGATGQDSRGRVWFGVAAADTPTPSGHLLEYDPVSGVGDGGSHGIIALQTMNDGTMYFTTHRGQLYRVVPPRAAAGAATPRTAATVTALGWMHPDGPMYVPSLFTANGVDALSALARHPKQGYQWLECQLSPAMRCAISPFVVEGMSLADVNNSLLYGSGTRDAGGGHYVVGLGPGPVDADPVAIRVVSR